MAKSFRNARHDADVEDLSAALKKAEVRLGEVLARVNPEVTRLISPCQRCGCRVPFDFVVTDEVWAGVPEKWRRGVLCLPCLDELRHFPLRLRDIRVVYFSGREGTVAFVPAAALAAIQPNEETE